MNSIKVYKYVLLILIILTLLAGAYAVSKKDLIKQIKVIIIWYIIILELNFINIYSVLSFYEKNKNRKGPKGFKGVVGPRGFKGTSILCQSCGAAGSDREEYGRSFGIEHPKIQPGKCIYPFVYNYIYNYKPIDSDPPPFDIPTPNGADSGWCATSVNNQFEPLTIAFFDSNEAARMRASEELAKFKKRYYQSNYGILDLQIVMGNSLREAKQQANQLYSEYELIESDLNEGTGGKFIYFVAKMGVGAQGVTDIGISMSDNATDFSNTGWRILNNNSQAININKDSGPEGSGTELYVYIKKEGKGFIKDLAIIKEGRDLVPQGFSPIKYTSQLPTSSNTTDFRAINNDLVDLNRGTQADSNDPRLYLFVMKTVNLASIDCAFVYKDNSLYIFKGSKFYKFSKQVTEGSLKASEGKRINSQWGRTPEETGDEDKEFVEDCSNFDEDSNGCSATSNCFFNDVGNKCEVESIYDAVYLDQEQKTYFFKGQFIYKYSDREQKIEAGYPKLINQHFEGVPNDIDSIFVWAKDLATYVFKGSMYYKIDIVSKKVERGYPKQAQHRWPGMPEIVNAIFSLPFFITRKEGKDDPSPNIINHTYVISQDKVYYIDPNSDVVEEVGNLADIFSGMAQTSSPDTTNYIFPTPSI